VDRFITSEMERGGKGWERKNASGGYRVSVAVRASRVDSGERL